MAVLGKILAVQLIDIKYMFADSPFLFNMPGLLVEPALSLITVTFPEGGVRTRALGVYAGMTGMGGVGVVAGRADPDGRGRRVSISPGRPGASQIAEFIRSQLETHVVRSYFLRHGGGGLARPRWSCRAGSGGSPSAG